MSPLLLLLAIVACSSALPFADLEGEFCAANTDIRALVELRIDTDDDDDGEALNARRKRQANLIDSDDDDGSVQGDAETVVRGFRDLSALFSVFSFRLCCLKSEKSAQCAAVMVRSLSLATNKETRHQKKKKKKKKNLGFILLISCGVCVPSSRFMLFSVCVRVGRYSFSFLSIAKPRL